ncbi:hypothetical protein K470DRAFT_297060 [Piedraia hortae CBS 480.64]|uniref:Uncharacterized protein n=1 Tax=Piedraia hortae CBS 480.64 TaxID=1314780 RepID=A0A6A7BRG6_9PEZI|nr:hypothetical protein K470DRAFT_297060 [Piedraia hortae CBS 480.64]
MEITLPHATLPCAMIPPTDRMHSGGPPTPGGPAKGVPGGIPGAGLAADAGAGGPFRAGGNGIFEGGNGILAPPPPPPPGGIGGKLLGLKPGGNPLGGAGNLQTVSLDANKRLGSTYPGGKGGIPRPNGIGGMPIDGPPMKGGALPSIPGPIPGTIPGVIPISPMPGAYICVIGLL